MNTTQQFLEFSHRNGVLVARGAVPTLRELLSERCRDETAYRIDLASVVDSTSSLVELASIAAQHVHEEGIEVGCYFGRSGIRTAIADTLNVYSHMSDWRSADAHPRTLKAKRWPFDWLKAPEKTFKSAPEGATILVEDFMLQASSTYQDIQRISRLESAHVGGVLVIVDGRYMQQGERTTAESIEDMDVPVITLSTKKELIDYEIERYQERSASAPAYPRVIA